MEENSLTRKGDAMMLNRSITYRSLLRIAGALFLLWAFYQTFRIATIQVYENSNTFWRYQIEVSATDTLFNIAWYGVLFFVAAGLLLLGLSSRHMHIAYWSVQVTVWLVGVSLWYRSNHEFNPFPLDSFWLIVTVICSLGLLALYKPMLRLLRWAEGTQGNNRPLPLQIFEE
jgi:hypothetical protein